MNIIKRFYKHIIFFILLFILAYSGINYFFQHQQKKYLTDQTELLNKQYATQYRYFKIMSQDIYEMYKNNKKLRNLLTKADAAKEEQKNILRQQIYDLLKKRYKRLVNMGVKQLQFHTKENKSLLRMHAPAIFGDSLSDIRESVVYVNKNKKYIEGFEVGKFAHGFRFVYPCFSKDGLHIGSMEVSFSAKQLLSYIKDKFIIDKHIIISKDEITRKLDPKTIEKLYKSCLNNVNYFTPKEIETDLSDKQIHTKILDNADKKAIKNNMKRAISFSITSSYNGNSIFLTFIPMNGIKHSESTAYLVITSESADLDTLVLEKGYAIILLTTVLSLLFILSIYISITQRNLELMAHYDKLTKLPNRAYFYTELDRELKRAKRLEQKFSIMFIDLDGFKLVNDTYGHKAGDTLLVQTAKRLQESIREIDLVARIGGDEFIILVSNVQNDANTAKIANKIIDTLGEDFFINNVHLNIGASIGIASYPKDAKNIDDLVNHADSAMYEAKESGKNHFVIYKK